MAILQTNQTESIILDDKSVTVQAILIFSEWLKKHVRKCWYGAYSPFPRMFSKLYITRTVETWNCEVKRYTVGNELNFQKDIRNTAHLHKTVYSGKLPSVVCSQTCRFECYSMGHYLHCK